MAKNSFFPASRNPTADTIQTLACTAPIVRQGVFVLKHAARSPGIKLTPNIKPNRAFVQSFWDENVRALEIHPFKPYRYDDCPQLIKVTFLLEELKLIHIVQGHVRITSEGQALMAALDFQQLFEKMVVAYIHHWNWAAEDYYPTFDFIQDSCFALVDCLKSSSDLAVSPRDLFSRVFNAGGDLEYCRDFPCVSPKRLAISCLQLRFFERFAIPFGLLVPNLNAKRQYSHTRAYAKTDLLQFWPQSSGAQSDPNRLLH